MLKKQSLLLFIFIITIQFYVSPQVPLFANTPVSDGGSNNNIGSANTSRNVAVGPEGNIYVVYSNNSEIRIAKSIDGGQSFLPSVLVANISFT